MRWGLRTAEPARVQDLAENLLSDSALQLNNSHLASTLARLLVLRGITDIESARHYLAPSLAHLHSPYLMTGMKAAIDRLDVAIERKEGILIYGDYDVDGTTAIVILKTAIELCGGAADFHVPHRIREGYGMKDDVIERAAAADIRLIISVDTGIRALDAAQTARRLGVDLIVTDHHLPGTDGVPSALAVLNPNQPGCDYPCKDLCGAGVAFKLAQGLMERRLAQNDQSRLLTSFMKMVAIATIADAVPLTGENRVFAKLGLEALRSPVNVGLRALFEVAQVGGRALNSGEVAFRVAPRLNAAGRMDVARDVIELFSVKDAVRAKEIANRLDQLNAERQEEERRILDAIDARFAEEPALHDAFCIVIDGDGWHRGVIGLAASKIAERLNRPCVVISLDGDVGHGSARSIPAYHLFDGLTSCRELLQKFGGHSHAAGLSIHRDQIPEFRRRLNEHAASCLTEHDLMPALEIDAEILPNALTFQLSQELRALEPFGAGNPRPVFGTRGLRVLSEPQIIKNQHLKLRVAGDDKRPLEAIWWRAVEDGEELPHINQRIDLAYEFEATRWQGDIRLQLNVRDMRLNGES